jgi:hypothetical protein
MENKNDFYLKIEAGDFSLLDEIPRMEMEIAKNDISSKLELNEVDLKNIIMQNSAPIVNLLNSSKNLKEDLIKSKKNLELLDMQIKM